MKEFFGVGKVFLDLGSDDDWMRKMRCSRNELSLSSLALLNEDNFWG